MKEIEIYTSPDNQIEIEVNLQKETVWLSQKQMADLFGKDSDTIGLHLKNIYKEKELEEEATTEYFSVVQTEGKRKVNRNIKYYNLDAIISVGYRVNSKRGTQFRQWATQRLREYLVQGYALNEKRLKEARDHFTGLRQAVSIMDKMVTSESSSGNQMVGIFKVLNDYASALDILDQYDHQKLKIARSKSKEVFRISYKEAKRAIKGLKEKFGGSALLNRYGEDHFSYL